MSELTFTDDSNSFEYPSFKETGWLYLKIRNGVIEEYDYEGGSVFWLIEYGCMEYVVEQETDLLKSDGDWLIEEITCHFDKGDGWATDDDMDWYFGNIREAVPEEKM